MSLLCPPASPNMRPPMSCVLAVLVGDTEVGLVTSKPGYLTDWDFKYITNSFLSEEDRRQPANNTDLGQLADPMPSPVNVTDSMFDGIVGDGR